MLAAVKKGRAVNEAEIPPPVATGAPSAAPRPAVPHRPAPPVPSPPGPAASDQQGESEAAPPPPLPEIITPSSEEEQSSSSSSTPLALSSVPSPEEPTEEPAVQPQTSPTGTCLHCVSQQERHLKDRQKHFIWYAWCPRWFLFLFQNRKT